MSEQLSGKISFGDWKVAIVSHDAGGAEVLSSYVRRFALNPVYVLDGPAKSIFKLKLGSVETCSLEEALQQSDFLLCSTSWQSDLEFHAIRKSREKGIPSVAFLDHWVNYRERFLRNNELVLPDQIWVGDKIAADIAAGIFGKHPIFLEENPYFLDIKDNVTSLARPAASDQGLSVLYVCEPIKEHAKLRYGNERHWGYVEEDALRYFLDNVEVLGARPREIRIRPHPSEADDKYAWVFDEFSLPIVQGGGRSLLSEITGGDVVVGCESMAMVIGLLAGKRVISCIPPGGRECVLPQSEILKLQHLILKANTGARGYSCP